MSIISLKDSFIDHFNISEYEVANNGGQKRVFIVTILDIKYALKIINIVDERFEREVKICKQFDDNIGITKIYKIEKFEKETIILEEYIEGNDLSEIYMEYINDEKKVCELVLEIAEILIPIWTARYVHRDLKPHNIRIRRNGKPVVLDFGIARALDEDSITLSGIQPLTYFYASPEQYSGHKNLISYKTDFFCLGIIAYFLFTNTLPFGNDRNIIAKKFQDNELSIIMKSQILNNFCNNVFKKNPSERPRRIETFLKLLQL